MSVSIYKFHINIIDYYHVPAMKLDVSYISLFDLFILSGSSSKKCIMNAIVVGGLHSQSRLSSIFNSMFVIVVGLNLFRENHAKVELLMIADSLTLIAICRVAIDTRSTSLLLIFLFVLCAKYLSTRIGNVV